MSQLPTPTQRIKASIQSIKNVKERIAQLAAQMDVLLAEYKGYRTELKEALGEISPDLVAELIPIE